MDLLDLLENECERRSKSTEKYARKYFNALVEAYKTGAKDLYDPKELYAAKELYVSFQESQLDAGVRRMTDQELQSQINDGGHLMNLAEEELNRRCGLPSWVKASGYSDKLKREVLTPGDVPHLLEQLLLTDESTWMDWERKE